jgi:predicted nucleic acid-binding protein
MAMMGAEPVFVDTNVLVHANNADSPFQEEARQRLRALAAAGHPMWISRQVLREYAAVISRLMSEGNVFDGPALAADLLRFEQEFRVADDTAAVSAQLRALIVSHSVKGKQTHDANVTATMLVHGITRLLTHNENDSRRFVPLIEILLLVPAE